jgi:hypothetical protein
MVSGRRNDQMEVRRMTYDGPLRMDVLAVLVSLDVDASRTAVAWTLADGRRCKAAEADLIDGATDDEWEVAGQLLVSPDPAAVAQLLALAAGSQTAVLLSSALREAFQPLDEESVIPAGQRSVRFADLFRKVAAPGLGGADAEAAEAVLAQIGGGHGG